MARYGCLILIAFCLFACAEPPAERFTKAQKLYGSERYTEADTLFAKLSDDPDYGFRARSMRAMIAFFNKSPDTSLAMFQTLEKDNPPTTPHYDFVLLSIARIQYMRNDYPAALDAYFKYNDHMKGKLDPELQQEIATVFKALLDTYRDMRKEELSLALRSDMQAHNDLPVLQRRIREYEELFEWVKGSMTPAEIERFHTIRKTAPVLLDR